MESVFKWLQNNVQKGENAGYLYLSLVLTMCSKSFLPEILTLYHTILITNDPKEKNP